MLDHRAPQGQMAPATQSEAPPPVRAKGRTPLLPQKDTAAAEIQRPPWIWRLLAVFSASGRQHAAIQLVAQLAQRLVLNLPHALLRHAELLGHLPQRLLVAAAQAPRARPHAEALREHLPLGLGQIGAVVAQNLDQFLDAILFEADAALLDVV